MGAVALTGVGRRDSSGAAPLVADLLLGGLLVRLRSLDGEGAGLLHDLLPDLEKPVEQSAHVEVDVRATDCLPGPEDGVQPVRLPRLRYWSSAVGFTVATNAAEGRLSPDRARIDVSWIPGSRDLFTGVNRCLRPLISMAVARHGLHPIHAASVSIGDSAVGVLGASGAGKSTLAGRMVDLGATFMSDDTSFVKVDPPALVGLRDHNRPRISPDRPDGTEAPRRHLRRPSDDRLLPIERFVVLTQGQQTCATTRPMPPEEIMTWLLMSGHFGVDAVSEQDRFSVLAKTASAVPALLVTLGVNHPEPDDILEWMTGTGVFG